MHHPAMLTELSRARYQEQVALREKQARLRWHEMDDRDQADRPGARLSAVDLLGALVANVAGWKGVWEVVLCHGRHLSRSRARAPR